jgi:thiamine pyrophosphate-dependent acetolactate synthase large subunit-like protein
MTINLEDIAKGLSSVLNEEIQIQDGCIALGGVDANDYALLQIGANDSRLYFSAPIVQIDEEKESSAKELCTLMELNSDTKNFPRARIAYHSTAGAAHWIEWIEDDIHAQDLLALIQERGKTIAHIRHALKSIERA